MRSQRFQVVVRPTSFWSWRPWKRLERSWAWKQKFGGIITEQIRRLGASCDWDRERFTMDNGLSAAVVEAFVRLYEKGLIYRGPRLINWSPGLKTAVSDLEVEYSEEPGTMYYFKYMLKDSDEFIPVATTRPETILADTAVAVHPEDERFAKFVGHTALVPILNREIPVIGLPDIFLYFPNEPRLPGGTVLAEANSEPGLVIVTVDNVLNVLGII